MVEKMSGAPGYFYVAGQFYAIKELYYEQQSKNTDKIRAANGSW